MKEEAKTEQEKVENVDAHLEDNQKKMEEKRFNDIIESLRTFLTHLFRKTYSEILKRTNIGGKDPNRKYSGQMQMFALSMWSDMVFDMYFSIIKEYFQPQALSYGLNLMNKTLHKHGYLLVPIREETKEETKTDNIIDKEEKNGCCNGQGGECPTEEKDGHCCTQDNVVNKG